MSGQSVEIPVELAQAIVELGRRLVPYVRTGTGAEPTGERFVNVPGQGPWTRKHLVAFKEAIKRYPGAMAVLDFAADHPEEGVKYTDILEANRKLHSRQVAAELGAMSKVARKVMGEKMWPLSAWQDSSDDVMRYRMPAVIADWWKQA